MLCSIAKKDLSRLKRKKEITPQEFSKMVVYKTLISQSCKPQSKKKKSDFEKIQELKRKLL
jgi:hypothetical protein